jgi:hypothetical protein
MLGMQMVSQMDGYGGDLAGHVDGQGINFASSADGEPNGWLWR